ncbi:MAG: TatD family hydrolase [Ancrocorticia sp.]|uniref:TatD family hydrolase n=1 Tax=Ancrocorticia sp. TaxID=2593684 RepID=UPI003F8F85B3
MGNNKKKRHVYPDVPPALPYGIVDNHTHLPVHGDPDAEEEAQLATEPVPGAAGSAGPKSGPSGVKSGPAGGKPVPASAKPAPIPGRGLPLTMAGQLARMREAGIRRAITCGCEVPTLQSTLDLARRYPDQLSAAIGIHPNDAPLHRGITEESPDGMTHGLDSWHREYSLEEAVELVADLATDSAVVAIGETGLDYFRTADSGKAAQEEAFRMHIQLAKELDLPLQIHDREAHEDCVRILRDAGAPERTVFHCFSGDTQLAEICGRNGWYASFGGAMTYPANDDLREAFRALPRELILAETDAPYLTPAPWRGHPNAPYAVAYTVRYQAELLGMDLGEWCRQIDSNTREVYGV